MVPQLSNAPSEYQSLVTTYLSGLSSTQAQALWQLFLAQENLTSNPTATQDPFYLEPFTLFVQSVITNAPSNFQTVISANLANLPLTQQQEIWELFLNEEGLGTNPTALNTKALSDFKSFVQTLLVTAPPILQALAGAYLGNLSIVDQQAAWSKFLAQEGLTANPQTTDADFAKILTDFSSYVQNISAGQTAALSPDEVQQRQLMLSVFQVMLLMLSTVQNTQAMQQALEIFYGKGQDEYTKMMSRVPIYLNPPDLSKVNVNTTDLSKFTLGYDNISVQEIINYTLATGQAFNLTAKNNTDATYITGIPGLDPSQGSELEDFLTFNPEGTAVNGAGLIHSTDSTKVLSALENLTNITSPNGTQLAALTALADDISQSNTVGNANFGSIDLSGTQSQIANALITAYENYIATTSSQTIDSSFENSLSNAANTIAQANAANPALNPTADFLEFHSTDATSVYNALLDEIPNSGSLSSAETTILMAVAQSIASSNDPNSSSFGTYNVNLQDPTALNTTLQGIYTAQGGSDTTTESGLTTAASALATLNTTYAAQFTVPLFSSTFSNVINQILTNLMGSPTLTSGQQTEVQKIASQIASSNDPSSSSFGSIKLDSTDPTFLISTLQNLYASNGGTDPAIKTFLATAGQNLSAFNTANEQLLPTLTSQSAYTVSFSWDSPYPSVPRTTPVTFTQAYPSGATDQQKQDIASQVFVEAYNAYIQYVNNNSFLSTNFLSSDGTNRILATTDPVSIPWRYHTPQSSDPNDAAVQGIFQTRQAKNQEEQQIIESIKSKRQTISNLQNAVNDSLSNDANITQAGASILETMIQTMQSILSDIFKKGH